VLPAASPFELLPALPGVAVAVDAAAAVVVAATSDQYGATAPERMKYLVASNRWVNAAR
jgi:hypothetical protein